MGASLNLRCADCIARSRGSVVELRSASQGSDAVVNYTGDGSRTLLHNNAGHDLEDDYENCRGRPSTGAFGVVRMVRSKKTRVVCALKSVCKARAQLSLLKREVEINLVIDHPNIARLFNVYEDSNYVYMVLEVCKGGELLDALIKRPDAISEAEAVILSRQIIGALNHLHAKFVVHRDVKLENLLLKDKRVDLLRNTVKLIDFGLATFFTPGEAELKTVVGSAYYVAPEILAARSNKNLRYTEKVDMWSAGVVMYMLVTGSPPFPGKSDKEIVDMVKKSDPSYSEPTWKRTSAEATRLVRALLTRDVGSRASAPLAFKLCKDIPLAGGAVDATGGEDPVVATNSERSRGFFERLHTFNQRSQFEQAARHLIARHVDENNVTGLRAQFEKMDMDGDGMVSLSEAKASLAAAGIQDTEAIEELFRATDTDGSDRIDYTEFLAATMTHGLFNEGDAWEAFRVLDRDGDGAIGPEDLQAALGRYVDDSEEGSSRASSPSPSPRLTQGVQRPRPPSVQEMLDEADADGDGKVDFAEFMAMVTKSPANANAKRPLRQLGAGLLEFSAKGGQARDVRGL